MTMTSSCCCCGCFTENGILASEDHPVDNDKWSLLCAFVATVFFGSLTYARRTCNYSEILSSYKELIFIELQNLNLTGPYSATENVRCPSGKVQHILWSIYGMTQLFKCQGKGKWHHEIGRPVERMGQLIKQNCRLADLKKRQKNVSCKTGEVLKRRRKKKRMIEALVLCWQKLQSIYASTPRRNARNNSSF